MGSSWAYMLYTLLLNVIHSFLNSIDPRFNATQSSIYFLQQFQYGVIAGVLGLVSTQYMHTASWKLTALIAFANSGACSDRVPRALPIAFQSGCGPEAWGRGRFAIWMQDSGKLVDGVNKNK